MNQATKDVACFRHQRSASQRSARHDARWGATGARDWTAAETETLFIHDPLGLDFPAGHRRHLRTTNVVESPFAAVRLRTSAAKRFRKVDGAKALIWKLLMVAEKRFRKLNSPQLLPGLLAGKRYVRRKARLRGGTARGLA